MNTHDDTELKQKIVKELFEVSQAGDLDRYIRKKARAFTQVAVNQKKINGNVLDAQEIFDSMKMFRDWAARALPDGRLLAIPRAKIEREFGPQQWYGRKE